ncbi:hypothetical protein [Marinifilum breve]|nr:hypothetical protein [Marinifilum breve]
MKKLLLLTILIAFITQSCNLGTHSTWKDENIESSVRNEIRELDEKVLKAVTTNNTTLIKSIMAKELLEKSGDNIDQLILQASNIITSTDYRILNQFQVKNTTTNIGNTVVSGLNAPNDYIIQYKALNKEMFVSLLIPKNELNEFIITNIYGKSPEGWKLNILQFGQYKINGQTAPELYSIAKDKLEKGHLVDAANSMFLCSLVAKPANQFWQYQNEDQMKSLQEEILGKINEQYTFPLTINEIESKPQILTIHPQGVQEGFYPMIEYLTTIDLKDTISTKLENNKLHSLIGKMFKGIDQDKDYILYKAFSQMPDGKTPVPTYGFVKKLK